MHLELAKAFLNIYNLHASTLANYQGKHQTDLLVNAGVSYCTDHLKKITAPLCDS